MSISHIYTSQKPEINVRVIDLTPELARRLLERNPSNRRMSQKLIDMYASDIVSGRWTLNGEPIIVADTGELNDGQHRCAAVIEANRPISTLIVEGVSRDARLTTDMGRARRPEDLLTMSDIKNASLVSSTASLLETVKKHGELKWTASGRETTLTKQETLAFVMQNIEELEWAAGIIESNKGRYFRKSILALALILIARRVGRVEAELFIRNVIRGDRVNGPSDPVYVTREKLLSHSRKIPQTPHNMMEVIIKGWNAYRTNRQIRIIKIIEKWPEIER